MKYQIWPLQRKPGINLFKYPKRSVSDIENILTDIYQGTYPVVTSSGRSAITVAIQVFELGKVDRIGMPPFSSSCLYFCVGKTSVPVPGDIKQMVSAHLVYHQWGYASKVGGDKLKFEDGVDSLCASSDALFPNNGIVEILSLSKMLGVPMGGVAFFRREVDALRAKEIRDSRINMAWPQFLLCCGSAVSEASGLLWQHAESVNGVLLDFLCGEIAYKLDKLNDLIADRREKLSLVSAMLSPVVNIRDNMRLPVAIPVPVEYDEKLFLLLRGDGFSTEQRHFNVSLDQDNWKLRKVLPLPIHQDVPIASVEKFCLRVLDRNK
jgi:putative PLP-dependent aminotransferase (TIGR04422 family)